MAEEATTDHQQIFTITRRDDSVAVITVDVPGESHNILTRALLREAEECFDNLAADTELRGVVFMSAKPGSFIAGADIEMLYACGTADEASELARAGQQLMNQLAELRAPVVAAIHGSCLGGGLELALACDGRVCTDSERTSLGLPEVMLGLLPGSGGTQRLPRLVGIQSALDVMLTGRNLRPHQARRQGLVDDVVPEPILEEAAVERVHELRDRRPARRRRGWMAWLLEGNPLGRAVVFQQARKQAAARGRGNYPALPRIIESVETGISDGLDKGLEREAECFGELAMTPQARQLMHVYFASTSMKKDPGTDSGAKPRPVRRAAVLGAGLMGAGIAFVTAHRAGIPVRLKDVAAKGLNQGMRHIHGQLEDQRRRRRLTGFDVEQQRNRVTPTLDYSGFHGVDLAIEAVFEDLELKRRMVRDVEDNGHPGTIFASNTSSIPITRIAEGANRPGNVIGMHYFSPVEKMPLLEVITTEHTDPEVVATTVAAGRQQGKTVIAVGDSAGFYVNRILAPYLNEAWYLLREGVAIDHVDRVLKDFGFPVGPFALLDEVGLDVTAKVAPILHEAFGERMKPVPETDTLLNDGRYGRKSNKGFYRYDKRRGKGSKPVDTGVYELLGVQPRSEMAAAEIIDRTVLPMVNEAARCHDENVIRSLRDGDIGAVYGIGFPPFRGGPFRYMDERGPAVIAERLQSLQHQLGARFAPAPILERMANTGETFHDG
ncbi:MAG: fatty acid oxidation complex subunit alpha FadJ [Ectothiorhodospiraceae bacterium]